MSIQAWHLAGVAVPYVLIATALWGLASGAIKDAVAVGSLPAQTRVGRLGSVPTVPLAYALGFAAVAFIYGCALDRHHMGAVLGADPHAMAPDADAVLYGLAGASWLSALLLMVPYRWLRRGTRALLAAPAGRERAEARYRLLAHHLTDLVCQHAPDGRYEWLSPSVEGILGYAPDELVGRSPYELFHPDDAERIRTESHEQILDGRQADTVIRYRIQRKDGRYVWLESLTETIRDASGAIVHLQVTSRDVTERQAVEDELLRRAHEDPLTGLANRLLFTVRLDALVEEARGGGAPPFAVLYVDLDRFKSVNDALGHGAGDALLVEFAARLRQATRAADTVARIGGDEFAVILLEADEAQAVQAAARIDAALQRPFALGTTSRSVSASIGVALHHDGLADAGALLREADLAAYAAKARGRAGWALFTPSLREESDRRVRLEADLDRAVGNGELRVAYQPIVHLASGALHGAEALVRWQHPELGLLYPDTFISIAEETGRIADLDFWVMAEGLAQLDRWADAAPGGAARALRLAVNCSAGDLHDPAFADRVRGLVAASPAGAGRLVIEITESLLVDDPQRVAATLCALRADGVHFAMDDFGTGYSSLSALHALPVGKVKLDRAFVQRMHEDESAMRMVETVLGFARTLGMKVVAEGVETPEQCAALTALGCDYGQGYFFARPLAADAFAELLARPTWRTAALAAEA